MVRVVATGDNADDSTASSEQSGTPTAPTADTPTITGIAFWARDPAYGPKVGASIRVFVRL